MSKRVFDRQKDFIRGKQWAHLIDDNQIQKSDYWLKSSNEKRPLYKFEGDKVKNMELKDVFTMLQNWAFITDSANHNFFELNIGGKMSTFRLQKDPFKEGQILVYNAEGKKFPYSDFDSFFNEKPKKAEEMAEKMLKSLNEPLGSQTSWTGLDEDTTTKMTDFVVLTQIAESATPTEESFAKVDKIRTAVIDFELKTAETSWEESVKRVLDEEKEKSLLSEETYNELRMQLLNGKKELLEAARDIIVDEKVSEKAFHKLLSKKFSQETEGKLLSEAKEVVKSANKKAKAKFDKEIKAYTPKDGRVPGSDVVMRNLLQKLANGELSSFEELFKIFVLERTGGTQLGREMWYPLLDDANSFEHLSYQQEAEEGKCHS